MPRPVAPRTDHRIDRSTVKGDRNPHDTVRFAQGFFVLDVPSEFVDELVEELDDVAGETIDEDDLDLRLQRALDRYERNELGVSELGPVILNPIGRGAKIALAIGLGVMAGAALYWFFGRRGPAPKVNPWGQILCPNASYDGTIDAGDYVVVELQNKAKTVAEPTWAQVLRVSSTLKLRIAGETGVGGLPKPLQSSIHGFNIGDIVEIPRGCIYDRYRPGQQWSVLCGPALGDAGFTAISRAQSSVLGQGDRVAVVVRGRNGATESVWVEIGAVSSGQQVISGAVTSVPTGTHGVEQGELLEFLRDCVVDAEFGG